jgi:hypothetical protein
MDAGVRDRAAVPNSALRVVVVVVVAAVDRKPHAGGDEE